MDRPPWLYEAPRSYHQRRLDPRERAPSSAGAWGSAPRTVRAFRTSDLWMCLALSGLAAHLMDETREAA